ncbi:hypothetical protein GCM10007100_30840 [Roseibacillus persicicus]|uniref:Glycosyl transferase family 1 domain-containing protein n=2 Tax=Roseibacillus persicicus TaxID=454148 RepID=A0A918TSF9_9BACT|nr:hypothetical protein GCM10007100_30840 [Roseibacillus persicicus]
MKILAGECTDSSGVSLLDSKVHFCGMLQGDSKWGAFYCARAFVLPSHQENFGIAVVEALACGKSVLITDKVNIWREIKESEAGVVVSDTEEGVVEGLREILKWDSFSEKKSIDCYCLNFSVDGAAKNLENLIREYEK